MDTVMGFHVHSMWLQERENAPAMIIHAETIVKDAVQLTISTRGNAEQGHHGFQIILQLVSVSFSYCEPS